MTILLKAARSQRRLSNFEAMKDFAKEFYSSAAWKACRELYKRKVGGLCEACLANGIYKGCEIIHHKVMITPENVSDPTVTLNFANLEALCRDCHAKRHGGGRRYKVDELGRVII